MSRVPKKSAGIWIGRIALTLLWAGVSAASEDAPATGAMERVSAELKRKLSEPERQEASFCRKEALCGQIVLGRFYRNRDFQPVWMDSEGRFPQARNLIHSICSSSLDGLRPDVYHLAVVETMLKAIQEERAAGRPAEPESLADLDMLLTDAFLIYGSHLLSGRVDPETIHSRWLVKSREADLTGLLEAALQKGEVAESLQGLLPKYPAYARLRQALLEYRAIMGWGGWCTVPLGPSLHEGERSRRIEALCVRLVFSGDLEETEGRDPEVFDDRVAAAVRRFQSRHGLVADGVVGRATLGALNVPVEDRVRQIELNMERWRWLPDDLGERYVLINTAAFALQVVEQGETILSMPVVVGKESRRTPVFSGRMTCLILNPYWEIPHKLAVEDILPKIKRDFSSGCIRVEAPIDLAAYVLRGDPKWTREGILSAIETGRNRVVWLPEPIPVHVLYWTAWVDRDGSVQFREDVYDRDGPLDRPLEEAQLSYQ